MTYAEKTDVSVERSKGEIERTLTRYGASKFFTGWDADAAVVGFSMADRFVQFRLPQPRRDDYRITPTGVRRAGSASVGRPPAYDSLICGIITSPIVVDPPEPSAIMMFARNASSKLSP